MIIPSLLTISFAHVTLALGTEHQLDQHNHIRYYGNPLDSFQGIKKTWRSREIAQRRRLESTYDSGSFSVRRKNTKKKLTAIVHIGPHKTATTSIQAYTALLHDELSRDGYEMPWALLTNDINTVNDGNDLIDLNVFNLVSCLQDVKELWPKAKCNPKLIEATLEISKRNQNLILSSEEFARTNFVKLDRLHTLLKPWKHVRIVAYYRRFYEWLFSYWNQFAKYRDIKNRPSFTEFVSNVEEIKLLHNSTYTRGAVAMYEQYFHDVVVFNMHDLSSYHDVSEFFFCEAITDAANSCQKVKERNARGETLRLNAMEGLVFQEMAWHAEQANLWNSSTSGMSLELVANMTRFRHTQELGLTQYDFEGFMVCPPSDVLDWLLQTTLEDEKYYFPDFFSTSSGENAIKQKFEVDRVNKLCSVDAKRVIEEVDHWKEFFRSI